MNENYESISADYISKRDGKSHFVFWCKCGEEIRLYCWSGQKKCPSCGRHYVYGSGGIILLRPEKAKRKMTRLIHRHYWVRSPLSTDDELLVFCKRCLDNVPKGRPITARDVRLHKVSRDEWNRAHSF